MTDRTEILDSYRQWMAEFWRNKRITPDQVRALKTFCEAHTLTVEEHAAIAGEVGIPGDELVDEVGQRLDDWLRARRQSLPRGSGGLRFAPPDTAPPWTQRLPAPPPVWQNAVAGLASLVIIAALIVIVAA